MTDLNKHSYKGLKAWQRAMDLVVAIYKLTGKYPKSELYGLILHTRKTAVSIPSNIAEGRYRKTAKDYRHFLTIAYASGAELETQVEIGKRLSFVNKEYFKKVDDLLDEVMRMLNKMTSNPKRPKT